MPRQTSTTNLDIFQRVIRVETKLDSLTETVNKVNDGIIQRMISAEVRIDNIEKLHERVDPLGSTAKVNQLEQQFRDWQTTARIYRIMAGALGAAIFYILTQLPLLIKLFHLL